MRKRSNKIKVGAYIDRDVWDKFRELVKKKYRDYHGMLSYELEEMIKNWIALHTQTTHKESIPKVNPEPKVYRVARQIKEYIQNKYGWRSAYQNVHRNLIVEAISAVRGSDPRTIEKWMNEMMRYDILKPISPNIYELVI